MNSSEQHTSCKFITVGFENSWVFLNFINAGWGNLSPFTVWLRFQQPEEQCFTASMLRGVVGNICSFCRVRQSWGEACLLNSSLIFNCIRTRSLTCTTQNTHILQASCPHPRDYSHTQYSFPSDWSVEGIKSRSDTEPHAMRTEIKSTSGSTSELHLPTNVTGWIKAPRPPGCFDRYVIGGSCVLSCGGMWNVASSRAALVKTCCTPSAVADAVLNFTCCIYILSWEHAGNKSNSRFIIPPLSRMFSPGLIIWNPSCRCPVNVQKLFVFVQLLLMFISMISIKSTFVENWSACSHYETVCLYRSLSFCKILIMYAHPILVPLFMNDTNHSQDISPSLSLSLSIYIYIYIIRNIAQMMSRTSQPLSGLDWLTAVCLASFWVA